MSEISITIDGGTSKRLLTKGKLCDKNIVVTATGGGGDAELQEKTITENGEYTPDEGYDGFSKVTANVPDRYEEGRSDGYKIGYSEGENDASLSSYNAGYSYGYDTGYEKGISTGKSAEHSDFWDNYQQNGNRTDYTYGFAGAGWNAETFKPKYDIKPRDSFHLFSGTGITDLVKLLNDRNITLDLSKSVNTSYLVQTSTALQTLPVLNLTSRGNINYLLYDCAALRSVEKVILKKDGSQKFNQYSFLNLPALEEIRFEGTIGNSLEIKGSPLLSTASVQSIIDCLKDLTGATQQTLTLHATVGANMTEEQKAAITVKNWQLVY